MRGFLVSGHGSFRVLVVAVLMAGGAGCKWDRADFRQGERVTGRPIEQVQQEHTDAWMAIPGVVGTAIGERNGKPCILVLTTSNTEHVRQQIPSIVEGNPVVVQYVGEIRALDD